MTSDFRATLIVVCRAAAASTSSDCLVAYMSAGACVSVMYVIQVSAANADRRDVERMYNRRTISQLQQLAPFVSRSPLSFPTPMAFGGPLCTPSLVGPQLKQKIVVYHN